MLTKRWNVDDLARDLVAPGQWHPLPGFEDRSAWASLHPATARQLLTEGHQAATEPWPALPATLLLEYVRIGQRERYQQADHQRRSILQRLLLAACVQGGETFTDAVIDALWATCEESSWCWTAHLNAQKAGLDLPDVCEPVVDLGVGEAAALVAWVAKLMRRPLDAASPLLMERAAHEIQQRILTPCLDRDDFWWMGLGQRKRVNNWCPWIVSNWLVCVLLIEPDRQRQLAAVHKAMGCLDRFLAGYHADGGCDEGPGYWGHAGASLFDCLDILHHATGGAVDVFDEPLIGNIARYIYRVHLSEDWFVNVADASPCVAPDGGLVYRYGKAIRDKATMAMGRWLWQRQQQPHIRQPPRPTVWRVLRPLFDAPELLQNDDSAPPLPRDTWLDGIQVMIARDHAASDRGLTLAAKAGHNAESHNHNDVGHFLVYVDGRPALVDAGVGTYTRQTFSQDRYRIWTMRSAYHAVPTVVLPDDLCIEQQAGAEFTARDVAYQADDRQASLTLDLAGAYPPQAGLTCWKRTLTLHRQQAVELVDAYEFATQPKALMLSLLTPGAVELPQDDDVLAMLRPRDLGQGRCSGALRVRQLHGARPTVTVQVIPFQDRRLAEAWGDHLCRIVLRWPQPPGCGQWGLRFEPV